MGSDQRQQHSKATDRLRLQTGLGFAGQLLVLGVLWAVSDLGAVGFAVGTAVGAGTAVLLLSAAVRSGTRALGPADLVTLSRSLLVGGTTALVADQGTDASLTTVAVIASAALVLDGVDGQVARRTGTASALGARFDMEVDAFLILVLSAFVGLFVGPWVLAIGAIRYVFVAAQRVLPWLTAPLPPSMARKTVAAVQGIALVVAGSGLVPVTFAICVAGAALAALVWSFGRDIAWLWRQHVRDVRGLPTVNAGADAADAAEAPEGALELAAAGRGGPVPAGLPVRRVMAVSTGTDGQKG